MQNKRKIKDIILQSITYIFSSFGILILVAIFVFIFSWKYHQSLSVIDFLISNIIYWLLLTIPC